jgi:hypothetical protein
VKNHKHSELKHLSFLWKKSCGNVGTIEPSLLELLVGKLQPADRIQSLYHNHPALCMIILSYLMLLNYPHYSTIYCVFIGNPESAALPCQEQ